MSSEHLILGPPGTGKTTTLISDYLIPEITSGVGPERVAYVAFTRAARLAVQDKLKARGIDPDSLPWLRTIHSACYRLLGLRRGDVLTDEHWALFAEQHGYEFSRTAPLDVQDIDTPYYPTRTPDDEVRAIYDWARNCCLDLPTAISTSKKLVSLESLISYEARLDAYKRANHLLDFTDMLTAVLDRQLRPDVDMVIVDEAQDLSPLQQEIVEMWSAGRRVCYAGDDDQSIYGFQGADPQWLINLAKRASTRVLAQSHRVPRRAHALAQRVITRNGHRVPKKYSARAADGAVERIMLDEIASVAAASSDAYILARNRHLMGGVARRLREAAVPFIAEGDGAWSPLQSARIVELVNIALKLQQGARLDNRDRATIYSAWQRDYTAQELLERIAADGVTGLVPTLRHEDRLFLDDLCHDATVVPEPRVRIMTIHASKGREASTVIVLPDMSAASHDEVLSVGAEGQEHRLAYVACTRAIERLCIVEPTSRRFYDYPV